VLNAFGARVTVALVAVALVGGLGGCVASEPRPLPTPSYRITSPPLGLFPAGTATAGCDQSRPANTATTSPDDLVLGPLVYAGLKNGYVADPPPEPDRYNIRFFKIGPMLPAGHRATVTIAASARDYAGIATEGGRAGGYSSVTYDGCPRSTGRAAGYVFWIGGFLLVGRARACVPLEVRVDGEDSVRRLSLAIPTGSCG